MKKVLCFLLLTVLFFRSSYAGDIIDTKAINERNMGYHYKDGKFVGKFDTTYEALYGAILLNENFHMNIVDYIWLDFTYDEADDMNYNVSGSYYYINISDDPEYSSNTEEAHQIGSKIKLSKNDDDEYVLESYEHDEKLINFYRESEFLKKGMTLEDIENIAKNREEGPYYLGYIRYNTKSKTEEESEVLVDGFCGDYGFELPFFGFLGTYISEGKIYEADYVEHLKYNGIIVSEYSMKDHSLLRQVKYEFKDKKFKVTKLK